MWLHGVRMIQRRGLCLASIAAYEEVQSFARSRGRNFVSFGAVFETNFRCNMSNDR